jgi:8-oxo-dGTP pyrophosphatase MutT (NUDIX family)
MNSKYRKGVFIVTYKKESDKIKYLLLKRSLHWKGWEFPKGGLKKTEGIRKAIQRELKEETGLRVLKIQKFGKSGKYKYNKELADRKRVEGQTYSLYSAEVGKGKVKIDKREHSGFKWCDFREAVEKLSWANQKVCLKLVNKSI